MARILWYLGIFLLVGAVFFVPPAAADFTTISAGNTVFIGEQGLDITGALNGATQIGWWASGAPIQTSSPDYIYSAASPTNFEVSPGIFGSHTGPWYRLNSNGTVNGSAFTVADPQLSIRVYDLSLGNIEVTNRWVPTGDKVDFQIETNLVDMSQRGSSPLITIYVQSPSGAQYGSLVDTSGATNSLNISVQSSPFTTSFGWDTGNHNYATGVYTIWAECNLNHMYDNYGIAGKTISQQVSLTDQQQNPRIAFVTTVPTVLPTTVTPAPTSTPELTTQTTQPTPTITTIIPTPTTVPTTVVPVTTAPTIPLTTKSGGFEFTLAFVAVVTVLGLYSRIK